MKLGWRPGQGVGPRVSARKRRIQDAKLRGLSGILAEQNDMDTEDDAEATKHTFAPRDTRLLVYEGKQGKEGLGYLKGPSVKLRGQAGPSVQAPSVSGE
jgi:G patch domain-containing protein 1